jgi:hypothetical protein
MARAARARASRPRHAVLAALAAAAALAFVPANAERELSTAPTTTNDFNQAIVLLNG